MHVVKGIGDLLGSIRDRVPLPVRHKGKTLSERLGPGDSTYTQYDHDITEQTCNWIRTAASKQNDKPWCLFSSLVCPHPPFIAPQKFYDLYNLDDMPFDKGVGDENFKRHPWIEEQRNCQFFDQHFTNETRKIAIANYFGTTSYFDDNLGEILKALEETGLDQNTRIIYTSDHGESLGKRGLWGKSNLYEEPAAVPMLIAGPDVPAGHVCTTPVSHIDCYQTILDCVGLSLNDEDQDLPGQSMFEIASGTNEPERVVFAEYHAMAAATGSFMLRKGRYKLI
jgi:choline-sulfatase